MKSLCLTLIALLTAVVFPVFAAEWKTYKSPEAGFEVAYAADWTVDDKNVKTPTPWVMIRLPSKVQPVGVVSIIKVKFGGVPFSTVVAEEKKLKSTLHTQAAKIDGKDATRIDSKEANLKKESYLIEEGEYLWRLDFASHPSEWEANKPLFDKALASFKFTKKK